MQQRRRAAELVPPKQLVGQRIAIDGKGVGVVAAIKKVQFFSSKHMVMYDDGRTEKLVLRRKGNGGLTFVLLGDAGPEYLMLGSTTEFSAADARRAVAEGGTSVSSWVASLTLTAGEAALRRGSLGDDEFESAGGGGSGGGGGGAGDETFEAQAVIWGLCDGVVAQRKKSNAQLNNALPSALGGGSLLSQDHMAAVTMAESVAREAANARAAAQPRGRVGGSGDPVDGLGKLQADELALDRTTRGREEAARREARRALREFRKQRGSVVTDVLEDEVQILQQEQQRRRQASGPADVVGSRGGERERGIGGERAVGEMAGELWAEQQAEAGSNADEQRRQYEQRDSLTGFAMQAPRQAVGQQQLLQEEGEEEEEPRLQQSMWQTPVAAGAMGRYSNDGAAQGMVGAGGEADDDEEEEDEEEVFGCEFEGDFEAVSAHEHGCASSRAAALHRPAPTAAVCAPSEAGIVAFDWEDPFNLNAR
jgi:hypothetical protein